MQLFFSFPTQQDGLICCSNGQKGCVGGREMCCPALSRRAPSAFVAHWKLQTGIYTPAILPHRLEERWFCQRLQGAHPILNPSFKPLFCFSSTTELTAVWQLDVTAIAPHAVGAAHHLPPAPAAIGTPGKAFPPPSSRDQLYPLHLVQQDSRHQLWEQ